MNGTTTIDLGVVKRQMDAISEDYEACRGVMAAINTEYIGGTNNVWNTPSAASYIDEVVASFNDFITQFNGKYPESFSEFVDGVNALASSQNAVTVQVPSTQAVNSLSRTWSAQNERFNVPDDYKGFTETYLTAKIDELKGYFDSIQGHINVAVENGLSSSFCTQLRESLASLKNSATSVADEYSSQAAAAAVAEDEAISTLKSNT